MLRVVLVIVLVALTVYCTIEVAQARKWEVRHMPRWLWAVLVIGFPAIGPLIWLTAGRPLSTRRRAAGPSGEPDSITPLDDDPDYLRRL